MKKILMAVEKYKGFRFYNTNMIIQIMLVIRPESSGPIDKEC